ncbi:MAG: hypothetical protein LBE13_00225 [Bacteroidales bacterium]|jgi:hypothetical protein|nr:hypothetical protein [Bacteroidales bacterium]
MSLNKLILGLFAVFLLSCKQELKIVFPDDIMKAEVHAVSNKHIIIIYLDSRACTACSLGNLKPWILSKKNLDKYKAGILLVIRHTDEQSVIKILHSFDIKFPVIFDKKGAFKRLNDKIFKIANDGVFVIDKDKNVIFTGSPIATEEKWKSFVKLIGP